MYEIHGNMIPATKRCPPKANLRLSCTSSSAGGGLSLTSRFLCHTSGRRFAVFQPKQCWHRIRTPGHNEEVVVLIIANRDRFPDPKRGEEEWYHIAVARNEDGFSRTAGEDHPHQFCGVALFILTNRNSLDGDTILIRHGLNRLESSMELCRINRRDSCSSKHVYEHVGAHETPFRKPGIIHRCILFGMTCNNDSSRLNVCLRRCVVEKAERTYNQQTQSSGECCAVFTGFHDSPVRKYILHVVFFRSFVDVTRKKYVTVSEVSMNP